MKLTSPKFNYVKETVLLVSAIAIICISFSKYRFMADAHFSEFRDWYPRYYFAVFILMRLLPVFVMALSLYLGLRTMPFISIALRIPAVLGQSIIIYWGTEYMGASITLSIFWVLHLAIFLFGKYLHNLTRTKIIATVINGISLFAIYILLCLVMERMHPFAKYTMFNKFQGKTTVFLLRDSQGELLPLNKFSKYDSNELFQIYAAINKQYGYDYLTENPNEQQEVYKKMLELLEQNLTMQLPGPYVTLNRIDFIMGKDKPDANEKEVARISL